MDKCIPALQQSKGGCVKILECRERQCGANFICPPLCPGYLCESKMQRVEMCVHWMPQMSRHLCMDMNTCALFGSNYAPVANLGVCQPRDDAYFSIRGSWDGNESAFHSLACSCCMDDPNWGLWLGCSQSGEAACNVTHMVMMIMNVAYIKYRHAIVADMCSSCAFDDDSQCNMRTMGPCLTQMKLMIQFHVVLVCCDRGAGLHGLCRFWVFCTSLSLLWWRIMLIMLGP